MARPAKKDKLVAVSLRLPADLLAEVDGCAEQIQNDTPLLEVTRTDALRYLLQLGIDSYRSSARRSRRR